MQSKIQTLFKEDTPKYLDNNIVSIQQLKALNAVSFCQTKDMGTHNLSCDCGFNKIINNSCGNRHCPSCGTYKKEVWIQNQQQALLPTQYYHLIFTLPDILNPLIYFNQNTLYTLMYQAASETILQLTTDKYRATPGFSLILHTWGQTLNYHPHLHCILAGGGLSVNKNRFIFFKKKFFIHVKILSALFKGKFMDKLKSLIKNEELKIPTIYKDELQSIIDQLYSKDWVVYSKPVFKCAEHVIKYLGRYTHRVAISNHRIRTLTDKTITFSYKDYRDNKTKTMTLLREDFIQRFLMHVLPHRFCKIRHFGFLANRYRSANVSTCRKHIQKQTGLLLFLPRKLTKLQL